MPLVRLKQLAQEGAADNEVVTWSAANGVWEPQSKDSGTVKNMFANFGGNAAVDVGNHNTVGVGQNADANVSFHFPEDFDSIVHLEIVGIPVNTFVDQNIDLLSDYGAVGELSTQHSGADTTSVYSGVAGVLFSLDASAIFASAVADDFAGIKVNHQAIGTTINYIGLHMRYLSL